MKFLFYVALALSHTSAFAAGHLSEIFESVFQNHYNARMCGENIHQLIRAVKQSNLSLHDAKLIVIENKGFSVFGMVNAEYARDGRRIGIAGEKNWYFHVVLESGGYIYDFDFGNNLEIVTIEDYFSKMFFEEDRSASYGFYVGQEKKLKDYHLKIYSAELVFQHYGRLSEIAAELLTLQDYLNSRPL
jgi:hypothetical protein